MKLKNRGLNLSDQLQRLHSKEDSDSVDSYYGSILIKKHSMRRLKIFFFVYLVSFFPSLVFNGGFIRVFFYSSCHPILSYATHNILRSIHSDNPHYRCVTGKKLYVLGAHRCRAPDRSRNIQRQYSTGVRELWIRLYQTRTRLDRGGRRIVP